jgi:hypothetical protein
MTADDLLLPRYAERSYRGDSMKEREREIGLLLASMGFLVKHNTDRGVGFDGKLSDAIVEEAKSSYGIGSVTNAAARKLFYRISPANEGLVFAFAEDAIKNHAMRKALENSKTWGEFRESVGENEYQAVLNMMSAHISEPVAVPNDEDQFKRYKIPGYGDGDFPKWLQTEMEWLLPADIVAKFGVNGNYVHFDPSCEKRLILALRKRGYEVDRRDDLFFT